MNKQVTSPSIALKVSRKLPSFLDSASKFIKHLEGVKDPH
jgi:hypothetical protein